MEGGSLRYNSNFSSPLYKEKDKIEFNVGAYAGEKGLSFRSSSTGYAVSVRKKRAGIFDDVGPRENSKVTSGHAKDLSMAEGSMTS